MTWYFDLYRNSISMQWTETGASNPYEDATGSPPGASVVLLARRRR